jgi:hypothetical protein
VLCFEYLLDDLSLLSEEEILARPGPALVPLSLLVLRFAGTEQLAQRLLHWSELFSRVYTSAHGPQMLYRVVRYLHELGDERAYGSIQRVLHSIMQSQQAEVFMRTMAEVLRAQGHEQGHEQGHQQGHQQGLAEGEARGEARGKALGLAQAVLRLLDARGVRVDERSRERILSCLDVATVELWLERALRATRLSEVLDGPAQ